MEPYMMWKVKITSSSLNLDMKNDKQNMHQYYICILFNFYRSCQL